MSDIPIHEPCALSGVSKKSGWAAIPAEEFLPLIVDRLHRAIQSKELLIAKSEVFLCKGCLHKREVIA